MERGGRPGWVELAEEANGLAGRHGVDLDAASAKGLQCSRIRFKPAVMTRSDHEPLGELVEHVGEILEHQAVPIAPPPAPDHPLRQHDHVLPVLLAVDEDASELVPLDPRHLSAYSQDGSGYNPLDPGRLAQLGEHQLDKLGVTGSSPVPPTLKGLQMQAF
jgi:hypothetical protein